jgi:hypothetical protein
VNTQPLLFAESAFEPFQTFLLTIEHPRDDRSQRSDRE